ncbi:MAG TPA: methylthioribulose 1-phosphate dehydratase [Rhodospirillaceae bacterium]|nr:methylthioribulose 1-phosphate dehydratase [Rhodospirillaceae bacterium]
MTMDLDRARTQIISAGKFLDSKGLAPATSGNYSVRLSGDCIAITVSGSHKGRLTDADVITIDKTGAALEDKKPSAETALHTQLYGLFPQAQAILHVHSVPATVVTRGNTQKAIVLEGYEMLKAFPGINTHETSLEIPIFENSQDMKDIREQVERRITKDTPAYIIRDHGFYVWGRDMAEAERIAEALEYLLACEMESMKIRAGARA